jgi:hypothetical protein
METPASLPQLNRPHHLSPRHELLRREAIQVAPLWWRPALSEICRLDDRVREAVEFARTAGRVGMTLAARDRWAAIYEELSAGQDGLLGAITARAEAQTVRLALVYALLDQKTDIDVAHLTAALAVWEYAESSAVRVFGDSLGDPVADDLIAALRKAGTTGLTRTAIRDLFGRNRASERINLASARWRPRGSRSWNSSGPAAGRCKRGSLRNGR